MTFFATLAGSVIYIFIYMPTQYMLYCLEVEEKEIFDAMDVKVAYISLHVSCAL